jgi:Ni,Fe-hydrogenase maturation factor
MSRAAILEVSVDDIFSTHALVNSHAITLGTTLKTGLLCFPDEMPADIRIILIEVKEIKEFTQQMSPEVEAAVVRWWNASGPWSRQSSRPARRAPGAEYRIAAARC